MRRIDFPGFAFLALGALLGMWLRILIGEAGGRLTSAFPTLPSALGGIPNALIVANLLGTGILVVATLYWEGKELTPAIARAKLLWATGLCGSLTSYSALVAALTSVPLSVSYSLDITQPGVIAILTLMGVLGAHLRWWDASRYAVKFQENYADGSKRSLGLIALTRALTPAGALERPDTRRAIAGLYGTAGVNVGASLAGAILLILGQNYPEMWAILTVGFLGCYSTFSSAIVDAWQVWRRGYRLFALTLLVGTFIVASVLFFLATTFYSWVI